MRSPEPQHPAWDLWRRLHRLFPAWNVWIDAFTTPGAWGLWGVDLVSGLRRNPSTRTAFALMKDVSPELFDAVVSLAAVNGRRHDLLFRTVLVTYITVPLAVITTTAQITPTGVESWLTQHWRFAVQAFGACTFGVLVYFWSQWRSKQLMAVLDLIRVERGPLPNTALEPRDGG